MDYSLEPGNDAILVRANGRVDESTWEAFGRGLGEAVEQAGRSGQSKVIVDLSRLDYMSSRGLRVLTVAKRQGDEAGVTIILAAPNDVMREILTISRYDKLFVVTDQVEAKP
jgi:anti-anti-sigma factor